MEPYDRLDEAYAAIREWRSDNGYATAVPNWEVYDHWEDDPAKLYTDFFYLCEPRG